MTEHALSCRLLGAIRVEADAHVVKIAAPRQRALLALLLLDVNRTVSASSLIDGIWGETPPQHPESALHIVVCRLRHTLDTVAPRLVRDAVGYRIELEPDELDLTRAEAYAVDARRALEAGDAKRAAADFDAALACWSGEPLADVANFPFYDETARRLREFQIGLVESRNVAYLRCGRDLDVLPDIEALIKAHPWRERLRAHQMVALYRCGRQIDALAAYDDLRRLLLTDFGVDPDEQLQRLQVRILRRDPTLLGNRGNLLERADAIILEVDPRERARESRRRLRTDLLRAPRAALDFFADAVPYEPVF
jgi:DNA-binding SARP family transcriptional activator